MAIAGQPNVGKSSVFNALTGLHQRVGNWPGKTIERRVGTCEHDGLPLRVVDLPGTYSLSAASAEELITREFILTERPAAVVLVADATALERNLYLLAELLALPAPVVVALNMMDVAERQGLRVDVEALATALGLPVVPLVAWRSEGIADLLAAVTRLAREPSGFTPRRPAIAGAYEPVVSEIESLLDGCVPPPYSPPWVARKLLEGERDVAMRAQGWLPAQAWNQLDDRLRQHDGAMLDIVGARYAWIEQIVAAATVQPRSGAITLTERLDRVLAHPVFGVPALLGILGLVYGLTFSLAAPAQAWLEVRVVDALGGWMSATLAPAPAWLAGLVADGVLGGTGTVLTFLPILLVFFTALGVLEDTGYLARAAYVTDRFMQAMGLHGKSVLPLVLGFGCNVPAVMGTRVLENRASRLLTIVLAPFVPCAARFAVLAFLVPAFFPGGATAVAAGLIGLNLLVLAVLGIALSRLLFRGERLALIMELPLYHVPNPRTIGLFVWHNVQEFLVKAGGPIVLISVAVWALSSFPGPGVEHSVLAAFGRRVAPLGHLMGMDWRMIVALLASFPAKENAIAALGVLYGAGGEGSGLAARMAAEVPAAGAVAFLAMEMLFIPCMATVAVIRRETASWGWTLFSVGLSLGVSLLVGLVVFQAARVLGLGLGSPLGAI